LVDFRPHYKLGERFSEWDFCENFQNICGRFDKICPHYLLGKFFRNPKELNQICPHYVEGKSSNNLRQVGWKPSPL
jgi:hypothetical protein